MSQDIESYYQAARVGDLACISFDDDKIGRNFKFLPIRNVDNGKIHTSDGVFWAINGENCDPRWGGNTYRLVVPTLTRVAMIEPHLQRMAKFGTDRRAEIFAARAVLEGRLKKMPDLPPPPTPTMKKALAEMRAAMRYWEAVDTMKIPPGDSVRVRREASERLVAARISLDRARELSEGQVSSSHSGRTAVDQSDVARFNGATSNPAQNPDALSRAAARSLSPQQGRTAPRRRYGQTYRNREETAPSPHGGAST